MTKWSSQQEVVMRDCSRWIADESAQQIMYVAGYAGTGKTTIAKELVNNRWLFAAFTGKAALVMRQKGCWGARTIHSLIYRPNGTRKDSDVQRAEGELASLTTERERIIATLPSLPKKDPTKSIDYDVFTAQRARDRNPAIIAINEKIKHVEDVLRIARLNEKRRPAFQLWEESPLRYADGIVIDECSMVDEEVGHDLMSFGKKILVLGDPAQLPPVGAVGFFTSREPDHLLTEVHRQARESGILDLATYVREGGDILERARLRWSSSDCEVRMRGDAPDLKDRVMAADQLIVGLNKTRHAYNARQRELLGRPSVWPVENDKVICLRNEKNMGLLNGGMWRVQKAVRCEDNETIGLELMPEDSTGDETIEATVVSCWQHHFVGQESALKEKGWDKQNEQEFDYAYAITTHKAQGSQWNDVVLFDESRSFRGESVQRSWLYTGITRAAKRLLVIV